MPLPEIAWLKANFASEGAKITKLGLNFVTVVPKILFCLYRDLSYDSGFGQA